MQSWRDVGRYHQLLADTQLEVVTALAGIASALSSQSDLSSAVVQRIRHGEQIFAAGARFGTRR